MKRSLWLTPLIAGCYSYSAITPATAPTGTEVRARITGAASDRIGPAVGELYVRELTGSVLENSNGVLLLNVERGTRPDVTGVAGPTRAQVSLMPGDLVSLEQRKLDVGRTTLFTAALAAGIGIGVAVALKSGGGGEQGNGPSEPPPINRIPITIFRIGF